MPSFNTILTLFAFNWHSGGDIGARESKHIHLTLTECQALARSLHPLSLCFLDPCWGYYTGIVPISQVEKLGLRQGSHSFDHRAEPLER